MQGDHIAVAVKDAAFGRFQRHDRTDLWFQRQGLGSSQDPHALDIIDLGLFKNGIEAWNFSLFGRYDKLAAPVIGDIVRVQERIEQAPALDAQARLQRSCRIVEPSMDHLRIAGRYALTDGLFPFNHHDRKAPARQGIAGGQTHSPGPDHNSVEIKFTHG